MLLPLYVNLNLLRNYFNLEMHTTKYLRECITLVIYLVKQILKLSRFIFGK